MDYTLEALFGLDGQVAVITGGGGVLCGTMARALGKLGMSVAILDIAEESAKKVAGEITSAGGTAIGIKADVLDLADGEAAPAIKAAAEAASADTIVMGTRGLRQIEAVTFGSVSQEVCRTVECTCIAVH